MKSPIPDMARAIAESRGWVSWGDVLPAIKPWFYEDARAALKALRKWERQQIKSGRAIRISVKSREG